MGINLPSFLLIQKNIGINMVNYIVRGDKHAIIYADDGEPAMSPRHQIMSYDRHSTHKM